MEKISLGQYLIYGILKGKNVKTSTKYLRKETFMRFYFFSEINGGLEMALGQPQTCF